MLAASRTEHTRWSVALRLLQMCAPVDVPWALRTCAEISPMRVALAGMRVSGSVLDISPESLSCGRNPLRSALAVNAEYRQSRVHVLCPCCIRWSVYKCAPRGGRAAAMQRGASFCVNEFTLFMKKS